MQEWTNTEEMAGVEIAGVDNDGGKTQQMDNDGVELSSRFTVADSRSLVKWHYLYPHKCSMCLCRYTCVCVWHNSSVSTSEAQGQHSE